MNREKNVGIIGSGNSAWALTSYLSSIGYRVYMLVRCEERAVEIPRIMRCEGKVCGSFSPVWVSCNEKEFFDGVDTVFIATVTTAYDEVLRRIAPFLEKRHELILFSSKLGGCLLVSEYLRKQGKDYVRIVETDAIFACRIISKDTVRIKGFKKWNLYSSKTFSETMKNAEILTRFFPFLEPAGNFLQRGLSDFGAACHPLVMLINMNAVDRKQQFLFYYEGFTRKTFSLLEAFDRERTKLAEAYDTELISLRELLDRYYSCLKDDFYDTLLNVPNYRDSVSPDSLDNRYIIEDVSNTLVPAYHLARKAGVRTDVIDSLIHLSSVLLDRNFLEEGRTLEKLGLEGMSRKQLTEWMKS